MCGGRAGAAHSCARVFAHVVGARIAGVVCLCACVSVCALTGARHPAGSAPEGTDAASCGRAVRSCGICCVCLTCMNLILSIAWARMPSVSVRSVWAEDGEPRDRRFVCGEYSFARADGEDWDAPGNPYLERLHRVKSEF